MRRSGVTYPDCDDECRKATEFPFGFQHDEDYRDGDHSGWAYIVREESEDGYIKIGRALDMKKRLIGLQNGNPRKLRVIHKRPGGYAEEGRLQHRLARYHVRGEWYEPAPEVLIEAGVEVAADGSYQYSEAGMYDRDVNDLFCSHARMDLRLLRAPHRRLGGVPASQSYSPEQLDQIRL